LIFNFDKIRGRIKEKLNKFNKKVSSFVRLYQFPINIQGGNY